MLYQGLVLAQLVISSYLASTAGIIDLVHWGLQAPMAKVQGNYCVSINLW